MAKSRWVIHKLCLKAKVPPLAPGIFWPCSKALSGASTGNLHCKAFLFNWVIADLYPRFFGQNICKLLRALHLGMESLAWSKLIPYISGKCDFICDYSWALFLCAKGAGRNWRLGRQDEEELQEIRGFPSHLYLQLFCRRRCKITGARKKTPLYASWFRS